MTKHDEKDSTNNQLSPISLKFRGILRLKNNKWGARISFNYKNYWLGTYDTEQEAAMAYDRASIKLQRSDVPLNLPAAHYTICESLFQAQYSEEEILNMLKDKTYEPKLMLHRANELAAMEHKKASTNQQNIMSTLIFEKKLTRVDLINSRGFHIPKGTAIKCFPQLAQFIDEPIELVLHDKSSCQWIFNCFYWKSTNTFVFTEGWKHFLVMNKVKTGDVICLYKCKSDEVANRQMFCTIDIRRGNVEQYVGGISPGKDVVGESAKEVETTSDVMLFGVNIAKKYT